METRYGSENPETEAFMRRSVEPDRRSARASSRKHVVAAVGASVLAGSALLAYNADRSSSNMLRAETGSETPMHLASNFEISSYEVPNFLQNNAEIVVFAGAKQGLCMDDGSARVGAFSAFVSRECKPTSVDQVFVYDEHNLMLRSAKKPNLCMSGGGSSAAGEGAVHMAICDPGSDDQRFIYDYINTQFRNPIKDLCVDDGGATVAGETTYKMEKCQPGNPNQIFTILWQNEVGGQVDEYKEEAEAPSEPQSPMEPEPRPLEGYPQPTESTPEGEPIPMEPVPTEPYPEPTTYPAPGENGYGVPPMEPEPQPTEGYPQPTEPEPQPTEGLPQPTEGYPQPTESTPEGEPIPMEPVPTEPYPEPTTYPAPGENGYGVPPMEPKPKPTEGYPQPTEPEPQPTEGYPQPTEPEPQPTEPEPQPLEGYPQSTEPVHDATDEVPSPGLGYLEEPSGEPRPVDPSNPNPVFTDFNLSDIDGDWNLLAPSNETIVPVNTDSSDDITSDEIFAYLLGIKTIAEKQFELTMSKYHRTYECATAGLQSFAKTSVSVDEYHALVRWMYEHCQVNPTTPPRPIPDVEQGSGSQEEEPSESSNSSEGSSTGSKQVERVYMTKLEFYQQIKDHFASQSDELQASAESANLRSHVATATRKKLLECIEEASNRFGRYKEYELPQHFHAAISWVQDECMNSA